MRDTNYLGSEELEFIAGLTGWLNDRPHAELAVEIRLIDSNGDLVGYVDVLPIISPREYGYYPAGEDPAVVGPHSNAGAN